MEVLFEKKGFVGIVTLNRPHVHHALSLSLLQSLNEIIDEINRANDIRVVVITSSGEKAFCAGADLKERAMMNEEEVRQAVAFIRETINKIEQIPIPVIGVANGSAYGGGLELVLACDIRIACENIQIGLTETSLGIIPGAGGTQRLSRIIGVSRAKELIFTARKISTRQAYEYGIFQYVWSREDVKQKTMILCEEIVKNAPLSVRAAKFAIDKGYDTSSEHGLLIEQLAYESILYTEDRKEGLAAFKEKRTPIYKGV
ncbi:MAG: enoyl-CoA hydratase-related protein [Bacillaceae bacterium]